MSLFKGENEEIKQTLDSQNNTYHLKGGLQHDNSSDDLMPDSFRKDSID